MRRAMSISELTRDARATFDRIADDGIPIVVDRRGDVLGTLVRRTALDDYGSLLRRWIRQAAAGGAEHETVRAYVDALYLFAVKIDPICGPTGVPLTAPIMRSRIEAAVVEGVRLQSVIVEVNRQIGASFGDGVAFNHLDVDSPIVVERVTPIVEVSGVCFDDARTWGVTLAEAAKIAAAWNCTYPESAAL